MTEGNFSETSLFSAQGLKDVFGVAGGSGGAASGGGVGHGSGSATASSSSSEEGNGAIPMASAADIEAAMAAAEDDEDVSAMRGARAEAAKDADQVTPLYPVYQYITLLLYTATPLNSP